MKPSLRKSTRSLALLLTLLVFFSLLSFPAEAASTKTISASKLEAGKQFTLTCMPYNGKYSPIKDYKGKTLNISSVQNFAFTPDGKYIFTTAECRTGSTKHTLLTRCAVPDERGASAEAECLEAFVLGNYGHGEAIAITQDDTQKEIYNLWVATTPSSSGTGTEIARITYKVTGSTGKITKTVRITNFKKANVTNGKAAYFDGKPTPRRLNVAIDTESNQIMFRVQFPVGQGVNYVSYDFKKLNAALDKVANNKTYSITKAAKLQKANLRTSLVPYDTFQSYAISGNTLYVCGGHMNKGAQIYAITYKTADNGKSTLEVKQNKSQISRIINITPKITVNGKTLGKSALEIEGMKLIPNAKGKLEFYVNFYMKSTPIANSIGIYKFAA